MVEQLVLLMAADSDPQKVVQMVALMVD